MSKPSKDSMGGKAKAGLGRGLGRGFDTLFPTSYDAGVTVEDKNRIKQVSIKDLVRNENQPRTHFDDEAITQLAQSVKRHGILQPLIVTPAGNGAAPGSYVIVAGERRWRAAQSAGLAEVPVIVRTMQELEKLEIGLVENVQRVDLSPLEQAASIQRLHDEFNIDFDDVAARIGKARSTVTNIVRLLTLPPAAKAALQQGDISEGHARAILALKEDASKQKELLELIIAKGWSVRQAEAFVTAYKQGAQDKEGAERRTAEETPATQRLGTVLGTPVAIKRMAKGGRLMITFTSDDELDRIINTLID